ncbi:conjugal transfer protein TraG N-terminal domain-containing protein (plasmid) [Zobellella denitrificans]
MISNVVIEPLMIEYAAKVNLSLWTVVVDSGLIYLPLIIEMLLIVGKTYSSADSNESWGTALLPKMEVMLIRVVLVIMFFAAPWDGVISSVRLDNYVSYSCNSKNLISGTEPGQPGQFGAANPQVHLNPAFTLVHDVATYVTNTMVANSPCAEDIRYASLKINNDKITDPNVAQISTQFFQQCVMPAVQAATRESNLSDDLWIGSPALVSHYGRETSGATLPRDLWLSAGPASAGNDLDPARGPDAYPNCQQVYQHLAGKIGQQFTELPGLEQSWLSLKSAQMEMSVQDFYLSTVLDLKSASYGSGESGWKKTITQWMDPREALLGTVLGGGSASEWGSNALLSFGGHIKNIGASVDAVAYRAMAPIVITAVQAMIIMAIPLITLATGYRALPVLQIILAYFVLETTLGVLEFATWIDNVVSNLVLTNPDLFNPEGDMPDVIMRLMANICYQWLPLIWIGIWGIVGIGAPSAISGFAGGGAGAASAASNAYSLTKGVVSGGGKTGGARMPRLGKK